MLLFFRQIQKLPLRILRDPCRQAVVRISQRLSSQSKGENVIGLSRALLRVCEGAEGLEGVGEGEAVMQVVKGLTMEVHDSNRVELFLIKIRIHLLAIRWSRIRGNPPHQLISRAALFLEHMKNSPFFDTIAADYYSRIERLYLEVVREKLRAKSLGQALRLIGGCMQSLKQQFAVLGVWESDKKVQALLESKVQLLQVLFRYEHAARMATPNSDYQTITTTILPKYERIAQKAHSVHFPTDMLLIDCDTLWMPSPTSLKHPSLRQSQAEERSTSLPFQFSTDTQKHRQSLQDTAQYLDEFFRNRSSSVGQRTLDRNPMAIPSNIRPHPSSTRKPSYFSREKLEHLNEPEQKSMMVCMQKGGQEGRGKGQGRRREWGGGLIEARKFKLVLDMDNKARQKLIQMNPFASMKTEELHMLTHKPIQQVMIC